MVQFLTFVMALTGATVVGKFHILNPFDRVYFFLFSYKTKASYSITLDGSPGDCLNACNPLINQVVSSREILVYMQI